MNKPIVINFWDDFYDDGHVPVGKVQKTYAYVETPFGLPKNVAATILQELSFHIMKEHSDHIQDVTVTLSGERVNNVDYNWRLIFSPITHKQLEALVAALEKSVTWARIISES